MIMKSKRPLAAMLVLALGMGGSAAALAADGEIEALKRELAEQRKLIEQLLAERGGKAAAPAVAAAKESPTGKPEVEIYGLLDSGVEHVTNTGAASKSLTRVPSITGTFPSRLGVRAKKEFAPGYAMLGTLEAGLAVDDGNHQQAGRIFGRQVFVGLQTPYGTFTVGRQYSMLLIGMAASDLLGPNIYGTGSLDTYLPTARFDNAVAWRDKFGPVSVGLSYSFGRDTTGGAPGSGICAGEHTDLTDTNSCRAWSGMVRYDTPSFGVSAAIDELKGGTGATAFFFNGAAPIAFADSGDKDRRINLGGYVKFGDTTVGFGWLGRHLDTDATEVDSDMYYVHASHKLSSTITVDGGVHRIVNDDQDRDATMLVLRGFLNLDKGLDTYLQIGHLTNSDLASYQISTGGGNVAPPAGESQTGFMVGLRYAF